MGLLERCRDLFDRAKQGRTRLPATLRIDRTHVDRPERLGAAAERDRWYFQVRVNELFLSHERKWFANYDPMVFFGAEFLYDKQEIAVPVVVGPALLEKFGKRDASGETTFVNTRVAGLHPYRGGRLALTVLLYRVQRENWARKMLALVESTSSALDFSHAVGAYTAVSNAVLDGVEALLGLESAQCVAGHRRELDPDAGNPAEPGYFVLLASDARVDESKLWVRDDALHQGPSLAASVPFRDADYVLFSLAAASERSDERALPFYPTYQRVLEEAAKPADDAWKSAKSNMLALYQSLVLSPDLTGAHADQLADRYAAEMKRVHERAVGMSNLGAASAQRDPMAKLRARSVALLDL